MYSASALEKLRDVVLDDHTKGVPGGMRFAVKDLATLGLNLRDTGVPKPLMVLRRQAMANNMEVMQRYCQRHGVLLAPHGKTTMSPQLFARQLDAGAWGISAATVQQVNVYRRFGISRIIFANQLVDVAAARFVATELDTDESLEFYSFVDSKESVQVLNAAHGVRPFYALLEVGIPGGRTGTRNNDSVEEVVREIRSCRGHVRLAGVAGFEGVLPHEPHRDVESYLEMLGHVVDELIVSGELGDEFIITAGGSAEFDCVVKAFAGRWQHARVILRSGCYVTHDHGNYRETSPLASKLQPALELCSTVQSKPEPTLALLNFGRRDAPYDGGLPKAIRALKTTSSTAISLQGCRVERLWDQHASMITPPRNDFAFGDTVVCGISHPCSAFDRWRAIYECDGEDTIQNAILTFF